MHSPEQIARVDLIEQEHLLLPHLVKELERVAIDGLTSEELDGIPLGAIQLDRAGMILKYNEYEAGLSGVEKSSAIGKNFFTEIAPCTRIKDFYGKFLEGIASKQLIHKFPFHFAFKKRPRDVTVVLFYSDISDTVWVFIRPI